MTPFRSIATDKEVYPRACVAFLQTQVPAHTADGVLGAAAWILEHGRPAGHGPV